MASKRKSTTPCMIPSKIIHPSEEVQQEPPVLLRQSRVPGGERRSPLGAGESSKPDAGDAVKDGAGVYTCRPCDFETDDLNLFLDHVYSGHPDFRADPSFLCVGCGASSPKFEGLALHNARIHPSTLNTTLQLRRRERRLVVEQSLVAGAEAGKDSEISITKTPIMRMLKGKSEPKRIAVPHPEAPSSEASAALPARDGERKETPTVTVTHVPTIVHNGTAKVTLPSAIQIVNGSGALPMLKTPITQVVSVVQNRNFHHAAPTTASSNVSSTSSSSSSKNLPKVMIPLSSIPTYSASMDSSSFLKTSFSKFPYPTKAELCYLTVVTKFPEEQIKIWFTAQRLKQGISWSPEEIEDARRKMFNTIIQTAPSGSGQTAAQQAPAQHTITVLPASLGAAGIPHILQGSLVGQGGVIVTQPVMANGIQVSGAPVALAVTPKPQAAARPMMQARPAAALVADKGISMMLGAVGSSISSRSGGGAVTTVIGSSSQASVINLSLGNGNHSGSKVGVNGKHRGSIADCSSSSNANVKSAAIGGGGGTAPSEKKLAADTNDAQKSKDTNASRKTPSGFGLDDLELSARDSPPIKLEEALSPASKSSSPSPSPTPPGLLGGRTPFNAFLDASFYKGKKSPEQLSALKDSFLLNQFPDQEEVERLISLTGLTVREVRKWFSDRRYHYRNLKSSRAPGSQGKSGAGCGSSTPGSSSSASPIDLSESGGGGGGSRAKTPQHSSDGLSPTATQTPTSPTTPSRRIPRQPSPDFTAIRYKEREPHQVKALETSFFLSSEPSSEEVDRLRTETKMTRREIHGWFSDKRKRMAAERKREEAERALREEEEEAAAEMEADGEEKQRDDGSGEPKVNPIKINLKMLKVTEANGKPEGDGPDAAAAAAAPPPPCGTPGSSPGPAAKPKPSHSPKPAAVRGKKTAEQLHLLKQVYARTQWPSAAQYDQLLAGTGLPRPEVVRWFGDCRYVQKNGQLKWLEAYQTTALEEDLKKGNAKVLQDHLEAHGRPEESQLQDLAQSSGVTTDLVRHWFSCRPSSPAVQQVAAGTGAPAAAEPPPLPPPPATSGSGSGSSPPEPQPGGGTEEDMEQSVCGGGAAAAAAEEEAAEARTDEPTKAAEGSD